MNEKAKAWFQGWWVTKGDSYSGNYFHTSHSRRGQTGGSDPGGGHGALGVGDVSGEERRQVIDAWRQARTLRSREGLESGASSAPENVQRERQKLAVEVAQNLANRYKVTPKQILEDAQHNLEEAVKDKPVSVRAPVDAAWKIVQEGRFKTQFEASESKGIFAPDMRADAEFMGLGIRKGIDVKKRPVYGYVQREGVNVSMYGQIEFVLKDSVKTRTTVTPGDSLGSFLEGNGAGTPMLSPKADGHMLRDVFLNRFDRLAYIEAQVQGGITMQDIARVVVHAGALGRGGKLLPEFAQFAQQARRLGMEVDVDRENY